MDECFSRHLGHERQQKSRKYAEHRKPKEHLRTNAMWSPGLDPETEKEHMEKTVEVQIRFTFL